MGYYSQTTSTHVNKCRKYADKIRIEFAIQDLNDIPKGFMCPNDRKKPWGTGHAILSASKIINEPFAVINGDDFYGKKSFQLLSEFYRDGSNADFSMVAFELDKTLSDFGAGIVYGLHFIEQLIRARCRGNHRG